MTATKQVSPTEDQLNLRRLADNSLVIRFSGNWRMQDGLPSFHEAKKQIESESGLKGITFDTQGLSSWDSGFITFLLKINELSSRLEIEADETGLPDGVRRLLHLATAVPEQKDARRKVVREWLVSQIGKKAMAGAAGAKDMVTFVGEAVQAFLDLARGKARFRKTDLWLTIQQCGAQALPIVTLISFLVGLILAFVGAVQLKQFGAQIYVANLVGIGMAREMGALMTAIIMAGRTGAAFAAQLGTMRVNQEIDALTTLGIAPMQFLVLPRMLALMLMMPLLCLYADLMGILGGAFVGVTMLDLGIVEYFNQTKEALDVTDFVIGLINSAIFGVLVAIAGCMRGIQCGNNAAAVGNAATSAVVTSIVFIVVSDSLLTLIYNALEV
ncbi:MAG: ABC transporter permease [Nitrospirota bacterium]|nr:MAG: ABC transporter permease [Nitrospirota bacterium]